jgi:hypothetical protein
MNPEVKASKSDLRKEEIEKLKTEVEKEAWIALHQYFNERGNGSEAKIAVVVLGNIAKELQAKNNSRQLDILEKRLMLKSPYDE